MTSSCVVQEEVHDARDMTPLETLSRDAQLPTGSASHDSSEGFPALEKWNQSRGNICRSLSTFWSFLVMGANDAAYGVSISLQRDSGWIAADQLS
jgi:hypothetical protein